MFFLKHHSFGATIAVCICALGGCTNPAARVRLARGNEDLRTKNAELQRAVEQRDEQIAALTRQVEALQSFTADRPSGAFAPVKIEIASLSGGGNFDEKPGDDGVTVHLRLYDADGDTLKAPGRIRIQVTDNASLAEPRVLAVCEIATVEELRAAWHGRFGTSHFTVRCPFTKDAATPAGPTVDVRAEFTDYLTGVTLTTLKQLPVSKSSSR